MIFPVKAQEFCERWLSTLTDPDEGDREFAIAIIQAINRAYYAGLEDGRKEAAECKKQL